MKKTGEIEDNNDPYDHTKQFFQKSKDTDEVEVGERKIKGDIDLDDLVYGGKKISRQQLEQDLEEESSSQEGEGDLEEEGEEESDI